MKTLDDVLRSREFNQTIGKALLEYAIEDRKKAYEDIAKAGYKAALEKLTNWNIDNGLSLIRVRSYLEEIIDVVICDANEEKIDAMTLEEYNKWYARASEYEKDKDKAVIPRNGYEKWFIDKWFSNVRF